MTTYQKLESAKQVACESDITKGLTKREFIATFIFQAICTKGNLGGITLAMREIYAKSAVELADSLLTELEKDFNP